FFFFQAEDGIRDRTVTGVQTCALPICALFGIFAFIDVPLVFGSIRWWRTQHPQPIIMGAPGAGLDPTMYKVLFFTWLAMLGLMTLLLRQRYRLEAMRGDLEIIQRELEAA